jgi:hypothetical protein
MAGWGDDPTLADLRDAIEGGWQPSGLREEKDGSTSFDVVVVEKDGESREFKSDHLAFHRYVEGLMEDFGLSYS